MCGADTGGEGGGYFDIGLGEVAGAIVGGIIGGPGGAMAGGKLGGALYDAVSAPREIVSTAYDHTPGASNTGPYAADMNAVAQGFFESRRAEAPGTESTAGEWTVFGAQPTIAEERKPEGVSYVGPTTAPVAGAIPTSAPVSVPPVAGMGAVAPAALPASEAPLEEGMLYPNQSPESIDERNRLDRERQATLAKTRADEEARILTAISSPTYTTAEATPEERFLGGGGGQSGRASSRSYHYY